MSLAPPVAPHPSSWLTSVWVKHWGCVQTAQDHAILVLLLNLVGVFVFSRPSWSVGNVLYHSCTSSEMVSHRGGQPLFIFTWSIGVGRLRSARRVTISCIIARIEAEQERKKNKIFWYPTLSPKRLGLVRATPWADLAVIGDQLWSIMTTIFWCVALSWWKWFLLWIIINHKRDLRFEFECSLFDFLVISHPDSNSLYQRIVQSWFASIPSL